MAMNSQLKPLVNIIINNYNYDRFLSQAIDSVLNQTCPRVIVVDDGSTDDSRNVILGHGDRILPILKENGGQFSAFKAAVEQSKGDLLFFLNSDDIFLPNKVEKLVPRLTLLKSNNFLKVPRNSKL